MTLLDHAYVPPATVNPTHSVHDAVQCTLPAQCDAVAVVENNSVVGVLTSRDVLLKVLLNGLDAKQIAVRDVMSQPVIMFDPKSEPEAALKIMLENNIRHLLLSEDGTTPLGMLSLRKLLQFIVEDQKEDLSSIEAFLLADSIGG